MSAVAELSVTVADMIAAVREQQRHPAPPHAEHQLPSRSVQRLVEAPLLVVAAHPGAGATTVATALTDALADADQAAYRVLELVDGAPPDGSGLLGAAEREVVAPSDHWRAGCRGPTTILRPAAPPGSPGQLPPLEPRERARVVIDTGWPLRLLQAYRSPVASLLATGQVLLVCRATVPGVRHAEFALRTLPGRPHLAVVGARRWPKVAASSFGPLLGAAVDQGRVVLIPPDRDLEVNGLDAEPLPAAVVTAASHLVELIWPGTAGASTQHRRRGERR